MYENSHSGALIPLKPRPWSYLKEYASVLQPDLGVNVGSMGLIPTDSDAYETDWWGNFL